MNKTILVIDDNEGDVRLIEEKLVDAQINVNIIRAKTGEEGIRLAQEVKPDLIMMDIMLPGMNGGEAARILKEDERTAQIPLKFLSVLYPNDDKQKQKEINIGKDVYDLIAKPIDEQTLILIMSELRCGQ